MRAETIERTYYTVTELQGLLGGSGFTRALDEYAAAECTWQDWSDEWASLTALDKHVGYRREQWSRWATDSWGDTGALEGKRAFAWLENAVLGPLRLPWGYMSAPGPLGVERRKHAKYRERPGTVPACPFTGYYTDEVLLDDLRDTIRRGGTVDNAMSYLHGVIERLCEQELDHRTSEEAFIEKAEEEGWEFLIDGTRV